MLINHHNDPVLQSPDTDAFSIIRERFKTVDHLYYATWPFFEKVADGTYAMIGERVQVSTLTTLMLPLFYAKISYSRDSQTSIDTASTTTASAKTPTSDNSHTAINKEMTPAVTTGA
ncbi:hypothetical protein Pmani_006313 [Petrolisthes manimaculis]|uniref:Uncharacterized protein n=1 Tax=Petrolisthes manimaculis TaxID=1843537 RepID=A0AAE1QD53_9EUCA|nr:hypothetical protein Pmani_006313 [Petrolisthes manimaculis]